MTDASNTLPSRRLFKSSMISSSTNVIDASGVLNAAASPAAAPAAAGMRRFCFGSPNIPGDFRGQPARNMHARTFPPQAAAAADAQRARHKFHPHHPPWHVAEILPKRQLELWNAAARRLRTK